MNRRVPLDQLLRCTALQPAEAVAIVQQLIHARAAMLPTPPFGPPTASTVMVGADGSVLSSASDTSFAVSELAALLDSMMPAAGTSIGIPGGLRYTIARARLEVDAPPFDSVEEFSTALARHERGDRAAAIQRVIARANAADPAGALDRRRADPAVAQLRRQLRDADSRVYDQQRAIDALSAMAAQPPSGSRGRAVAAGVLIGLTFAGAGELMRDRPTVASPRVEAAQDTSGVEVTPVAMPERVEREPAPAAAPKIEAHAAKRTSRIAPAARSPIPARPRRFQWLRTRFAFRADPL
jgi:hypothetical protein